MTVGDRDLTLERYVKSAPVQRSGQMIVQHLVADLLDLALELLDFEFGGVYLFARAQHFLA